MFSPYPPPSPVSPSSYFPESVIQNYGLGGSQILFPDSNPSNTTDIQTRIISLEKEVQRLHGESEGLRVLVSETEHHQFLREKEAQLLRIQEEERLWKEKRLALEEEAEKLRTERMKFNHAPQTVPVSPGPVAVSPKKKGKKKSKKGKKAKKNAKRK
eukprot:NODE_8804_length_644_cov_34.522073_g8179_i0.p1 GENE.NODE_8804_length_644_cov_34.522073_g8179_i0~~NODE_8804_length_644_cov_34.522073_g8179_i0.p1  ORF type:complete len:174 (+),score=44.72 NODE_8804_length_644_cov_34.522073_g8179_i0:53-523(+)